MILILGTGRSGTSAVAKILEDNGVSMGHQFHLPDKFNPQGYFEDIEFVGLNEAYTMFFRGSDKIDLWRKRLKELVATRKEPWGLKDPGIADFPELLEEYIKLNPHIILCSRNKADTIGSLIRFKNLSEKQATDIYETRMKNIKKVLKDREYLEIDCYVDNKVKSAIDFLSKIY